MAPAFLTAVLGWLRAGYPEGIPERDYVPLIALLSRRLSTEEVHDLAGEITRAADGKVDDIDIAVEITKLTNEMPRDEDVRRVRSRLAAAGWPLADPRAEE